MQEEYRLTICSLGGWGHCCDVMTTEVLYETEREDMPPAGEVRNRTAGENKIHFLTQDLTNPHAHVSGHAVVCGCQNFDFLFLSPSLLRVRLKSRWGSLEG